MTTVVFVVGYAYMIEYQSKKFTEQIRQSFIPEAFQILESDDHDFSEGEFSGGPLFPQKEWPRRQEPCAACGEFKKESLPIHLEHKNPN